MVDTRHNSVPTNWKAKYDIIYIRSPDFKSPNLHRRNLAGN